MISWIWNRKVAFSGWLVAFCMLLILTHQTRHYVRVCTHIMNINDGLQQSNASVDTKNRAHYLAQLCFVSGFDEPYGQKN